MSIDEIRTATLSDAAQIAKLVNDAYRPPLGAGGWTHESGLVSGARTSTEMIEAAIVLHDSILLVALSNQQILACVQIERHGSASHIGLLAVSPAVQGSGVGKQMLRHAEALALENYRSEKWILAVVSNRNELAAFYARRGYKKTAVVSDYPTTVGVGIPLQSGLKVELYEKAVAAMTEAEG